MKFRLFSCLLLMSTLFTSITAYAQPRVYTIVNDSKAPCYKPCCPLTGIYADFNYGISEITFAPYRGNVFGLLPLNVDNVSRSRDSFVAALGYDLYPCTKIPYRLEVNYFYTDVRYTLNPLFSTTDQFGSNDRVLVRNLMATLYFDWHTCTRLVPYVGVSAGGVNLKTYHQLFSGTQTSNFVTTDKENNFSWGGTIGTRYFFSNYFFANLQARFNNLGPVFFRDLTPVNSFVPPLLLPLPVTNYQSDYMHETTLLLGLGFLF